MVAQKKLTLVQSLFDLLIKYQNFAIVKIDKTSHQTLESLRKELKKSRALFKVIKNTLFEIAVNKFAQKEKKYSNLKKTFFPLKETSALLFLDKDWSKGLNSFYQFIKKETTLSFKFGLLDGNAYPASELLHIAQLPSRDQLIANIIGSMKSPTAKFAYLLKFSMIKLVFILKNKPNQAHLISKIKNQIAK